MEIIDLIKIEIIALMIIIEIKIIINSETMIDSSQHQTFLGNQMINSKIIIMSMNKMMKKIMIIGRIIQQKIMMVGIGETTIKIIIQRIMLITGVMEITIIIQQIILIFGVMKIITIIPPTMLMIGA